MKVGVTIPNNFGLADPRQVVSLAQRAEDLGYDSVWVMDHLFNAGAIAARLGDTPYYHPLSILSYVAAKTQRVTLGTSVMVLPYHHPVELAKYAATLDHLSDGRLVLGVGAGLIEAEFDALGIPFRQRGGMTTEAILAMKSLWTQSLPSFAGAHWRFSGLAFSPRPLQEPHIPVWVGGASGPAMRRAASIGDGWHPSDVPPERCPEQFHAVRELARGSGRDPGALVMSMRIAVARDAAAARPGQVPADPKSLRAVLRKYRDAGLDHAVLALDWGDPGELASMMEQTARTVLADVR
jgi:probable F420-dependent oxidoreductase